MAHFRWQKALGGFWGRAIRARAGSDSGRCRVRPGLEVLEDRRVPAAFTVNTIQDTPDANLGDGIAKDANGLTSLRAAIQEGNADADASVSISIAAFSDPITLLSALPDLGKNFTIAGPGPVP